MNVRLIETQWSLLKPGDLFITDREKVASHFSGQPLRPVYVRLDTALAQDFPVLKVVIERAEQIEAAL